jgi:predicted RNA-binding Zn ribbon-like protein
MSEREPAPGGLALVEALVNSVDLATGEDRLDTAEGRAAFGLPEPGPVRDRDTAAVQDRGTGAEPGGPRDTAPDGRGPGQGAPEGPREAALAELAAARELREALRAACLAHAGHRLPGRPPATALGELLAGAPLRITVADDGTAAFAPVTGGTLLARIAGAVAAAITDGSWSRLKACESETCLWAYYDRSPGGRGRWCSMSVCGSRAKMRAYRARTRRAPKAPAPAD